MNGKANGIFLDGEVHPEPLVLVWFSAKWCGPCRRSQPVLETLALRYQGRVKVIRVDVDMQRELTASFSVRAVPTLVLIGQSGELSRHMGVASPTELTRWLDSSLEQQIEAGDMR